MKRIILLALTLFILTGCVFTESEFTVNKDNSVDIRFLKGIEKDAPLGEEVKDMVKEDSLRYMPYRFSVKDWENDKYRGTESTGKVKNILDLNKLPMVADTSGTNQPSAIRKEEASTHDLYTISYLPNVMELIGNVDDEENGEYKAIMAAMLSTFEHKITWKVPFKVVATNASTKNDSLGVYTWDIKGAPADSIYLQYEVPKKLSIFGKKSSPLTWIIIGLVVVVLALMFFNMFKKRASKGDTIEPSIPVMPASPEEPPVENETPESDNTEEDSKQTDSPDETS